MQNKKLVKQKKQRRRLRKDKAAKKERANRDVRNGNNICKTDDKINWREYDGSIAGELCKQYRYFKDNEEFYFVTKKAFFTIDVGIPVTCRLEADRATAKELGTHTFYATIVRAMFVCPYYRGQGVQDKILRTVVSAAEKVGESVLCIADPFFIVGKQSKKNTLINLLSFLEDEGYKTFQDDELIRKQGERFAKLGMSSIDWSLHAQITDKKSHYIYVPFSAPDSQRKIVDSIREGWHDKVA